MNRRVTHVQRTNAPPPRACSTDTVVRRADTEPPVSSAAGSGSPWAGFAQRPRAHFAQQISSASFALSVLCQLQKPKRALSPEGTISRVTDARAKPLEVRGKKKTVSHLINGLNLISGEKAQIRQCDLVRPRVPSCKTANGKGWAARGRRTCCLRAGPTSKFKRRRNRLVMLQPRGERRGFRGVDSEVFETEVKF